jgi:hypothetical protein
MCFPISLQFLLGLKALKRRTKAVAAAMPPEEQSSNAEAVSPLYAFMWMDPYKITFFGSGKHNTAL